MALNWLRDNARVRGHESLEAPRPGRRNRQLADDTIPIDERLIVHGLREKMQQAVRLAVSGLPERQRTAVVLHQFEGIGCEQIAVLPGCSHQAVRSLLYRAYVALRIRLAGLELRV